VDGPRGPAGIVKPGVVMLAYTADAAIVPLHVSANRAWIMNSWDRFLIPKPFARVRIEFGNMHVVRNSPKARLEEIRKQLETDMQGHLIA
jgi:hypothetical protein